MKDYFLCVQHNIPFGYYYDFSSQQIVVQAIDLNNKYITIGTSKVYYTTTNAELNESLKTFMLYGSCVGTYVNNAWESETASYLKPSTTTFGGYREKLGDWPKGYYPHNDSSLTEYNSLICNRIITDGKPIKGFRVYIQGNLIGGPQEWFDIDPTYYFRLYIFGTDY